jgi:hypothetical protein
MINLKIFIAFMDAMIMFALFAIVLSVFGLNLWIGLGPAILYFIYKVVRAFIDQGVIGKITKKNPSLNQSLQAAYENRDESNVIAEHLIKEVSRRLDELHASTFLEKRDVVFRVFLIVFLFFGIVAVNSFYMQDAILKIRTGILTNVLDFYNLFTGGSGDSSMKMAGGDNWESSDYQNKQEKDKIGMSQGGKTPGYNEGPLPGEGGGVGTKGNKNIYGAPTTAKIEGQNVDMEVHPEYGGQINIEDTAEKEQANNNFQVPDAVEAARNPEQEPVEYADMIKAYFQKLSEEAG